MRWKIPFDRMSQRQKAVIDEIAKSEKDSFWIEGLAGSGKTLILVHLVERILAVEPASEICFVTYTNALTDLVRTGLHDQAAARVRVMTTTRFIGAGKRYGHVFLDEAQDIKREQLLQIRRLAGKLYTTGDFHQKIYSSDMSKKSLQQIVQTAVPESGLNEIFRLTETIRNVASAVYPKSDIIAGAVGRREGGDGMAYDSQVSLVKCSGNIVQAKWVWQEARKRARILQPSAILFYGHDEIYKFAHTLAETVHGIDAPDKPTNANGRRGYTAFNNYWQQKDIPVQYLGNSYGSLSDSDKKPLVYLMTCHSAKGLDFENVFVANLAPEWNARNREGGDSETLTRLLFVAVTRSRKNLFLSYFGSQPHELIKKIPDRFLNKQEIDHVSEHKDTAEEEVYF